MAGDFLYIPRGYWHDVIGVDESTLHLTVGSTNPTGIDLVNWLTDQLRDVEAFRQDIPLFAVDATRAQWNAQLRASLQTMWASDLIDRFLEHRRSIVEFRPHLSLPFAMEQKPGSLKQDFVLASGQQPTYEVDIKTKTLKVRADRREWVFTAAVRPALDLILSGMPQNFSSLRDAVPREISDEAIRNLVGRLVIEGFVQLRESTSPRL